MAISIDYKGWSFVFDRLPSSDEIAARYDAYVRRTEVTLPVPTPTRLERATGPYEGQSLVGRRVAVHASPDSPMRKVLIDTLLDEGADVAVPTAQLPKHQGDRALLSLEDVADDERFHGLIFDATDATDEGCLDALYRFVHARVMRLSKCAKVVVLGRPPSEAKSSGQAAVWQGIDGFCRAVTRELGISGTTVNRIEVASGAEEQVGGALRFLVSARSAYVNGQVVRVSAPRSPNPAPAAVERVLDGKVALVTGAARGIGRETAMQFAREGATVIWVDLPAENAYGLPGSENLLKSLHDKHGGEVLLLDVAAADAPDRIAEVAKRLGGVDILVNNAAVVDDAMFFSMSEEAWNTVIGVDLKAPQRITDRLIADDLLRDWGRAIFIASVAGISGNPGQVNYSTSKAALLGMVQYYAGALISKGITVNAVAAGTTETELLQTAPDWIREIGVRLNALSQVGQPVDTANLVTFLARADSQGINGEWIRCCGAALQGA